MIKEAITLFEFDSFLQDIEDFDAMEIHKITKEDQSVDFLIPYLMNDAVECILRLQDCSVKGEWEDEIYECNVLGFNEEEEFMVQQASGNIVTVHYQNIFLEGHCYQYHTIGHNWRKIPGEEGMRRLVNLLCVLHDKCTYLGEDFTNPMELELYPLITFAPLCSWTPINESINSWYPETPQGIVAMKKLVREAGDEDLYSMICEYENLSTQSKKYEMMQRVLAMELVSDSHVAIYKLLLQKIKEASLFWDCRDYGPEENERIQEMRRSAVRKYTDKGYSGAYPYLIKEEENGENFVHFVEEHPFTTMEWDDYHFHIFAMETVEGETSFQKIF